MKNKKAGKIFFKTLTISLLGFSILAIVLYLGYWFILGKSVSETTDEISAGLKQSQNIISGFFDSTPSGINFVILGTDKAATRTDTMLIGRFMPKDGKVSLVSIPRDTMVTMPKDRLDVVKTYNKYVASDGIMKLNEVHHHAGAENGIDYTIKQIEELVNVKVDYYIEIDLDGFKYLVDAIGGVEFDVPMRMKYSDPTQGLKIDLQPGVQVLDGENAEGLVRFRYGYARADIDRMDTQQKFLKAMLKKALTVENLPAIAATGFKYVKTNANVADVAKYVKYAKDIKTDSIDTYTLPTTSKQFRGKSFQVLEESGTKEIIQKVFYTNEEVEQLDKDSKSKTIQVLNGTNKSGLAAKVKETLEANGFKVENIGDYNGTQKEDTRIIVKKEGEGADLVKEFKSAHIEVSQDFSKDYDIVIIIGTSQE